MKRAIPVLVSSQAKRSHSSMLTAVSHNATPCFKNRCLRGVNLNNLINLRYSNQKLQDGFVPIEFCLLNTRSINKKELAIKDYAVDNNVDIFAMTETWLRDNENYNFSIAEVCPTGYCFYHVPRKYSRGGGVGILIKKHIKVSKQTQRIFSSFEYLDIVTTCSTGSTRIVIIYRPPLSKANQLNNALFFEEFCTLAEQLVVSPGNLLIVGDFNYQVDNISSLDTIKFNKILESFNLVQHVNGPTHKKGHTLDLIITRATDELVTSTDIRDPMLSDHSAVHCKLRLKKPPPERVKISYRKLRSINMDSFNDDLKQSNLLTTNTLDLTDLIEQYENTLTETLEKHAPLRQRVITPRPLAPWYHEGISDAKRKRRKLARRWRASRLCVDRQMYADQCQVVNKMLKDAKASYYSSTILENALDQKTLFNVVDKLLHRKVERRYPPAPSMIELTNNFADFFDNKIATIRTELSNEGTSSIQSREANEKLCHVEFTEFSVMSEREVKSFVDTIGKKSCDLDPIPASILKECKSTLLPVLTIIVNMSLQSAFMPAALKEAMIKPKLKKDNLDPEDYPNFRPISNLKVVSKIIEKAASCQLGDYLRDNDLEESFQSAYKRFHSTETALLKVQNDILFEIDNQKCVVLLLLDMSAAFDTVDHELLLERMSKRYGVKGNALKWFRSYLQDRKQFVMIDGIKSKVKDLRYGVPQGSVLGPILYLLYTSPIGDIIRWHGLDYHLYADDTQLYLSFKPTPAEQPGSIAKIEACVSEIDSWMLSNKLKLNRGKTELLILSARHRPPPSIEYVDVSGERIEPSPSARNIGVIFDEHMSLAKHVTNISKTCFFHLRNISKIRDCLSLADTEKLVHAFITSKIDSANSLLYGLPKFLIDGLQTVQNAAARVSTRTKKYDHFKPVLKQLHWLPVSQRIDYKILLLTYKALNGQAPGYIIDLLKPYTPTRNLRSSSKNLLNVPPVKLVSYGQRCFSYVAPSLWNSLPDNIRQSSSLQNFKTHIKTHLFNKCYDSD